MPQATVAATAAAAAAVPVVGTPIPPLIHAVAGSLGGALALLLFYPLERARIEMQKNMSHQSSHAHSVMPSGNNNPSLGRRGGGGGGSPSSPPVAPP